MGLLDGKRQIDYYRGNDYGGYQFTSLDDIINQFMVVYVGEGKLISKIKRLDVAFHAQRAMQELSFDTFKSIKSQEIELPPSNIMMLPHDYVNYTKMSWSDSSGIKHLLYPTSKTSNPFKILQEDDGGYDFTLATTGVFENGDFSSSISDSPWISSPDNGNTHGVSLGIENGQYEWRHVVQSLGGTTAGRHFAIWQTIDVTGIDYITLSAKGLSSAAKTGKGVGIVRIGFSTKVDTTAQLKPTAPDYSSDNPYPANLDGYNPNRTNPIAIEANGPSKNLDVEIYDVPILSGGTNYIEFNAGDDTLSAATELTDVDVSDLTGDIYLLAVSSGGAITSAATPSWNGLPSNYTFGVNAIDDIVLSFDAATVNLQSDGDSTTWTNYKSATPSENQDSYDDNYYSGAAGERYGIDPQHAQVNGSFYIDNLKGLINFSSNISGKTVILDYISDSLGTDGEMQVHKFAEEAMYKWISHAVLASRANTPEYLVNRYKKERFAAIRQAKLRLSNIKLEELTQILRGRSKWIKH
jgi:hypothetical protein